MSFAVFEPTSLTEVQAVLLQEGDAGAALAGGTDLLLRIRRRARRYRSVVNLKFVPNLHGFEWSEQEGLTFGALTTFRTIETNPVVRRHYPALAEAAHVVAGVQLRNLATIGGNLGNASPSADSVPPLVALGATVDIASPAGARRLPVASTLVAPGRTALIPGELFTTINIPPPPPRSGNAFARFSPRSAMDIGIASVAASITLDREGRCTDCRIALGAVSPRPLRASDAESLLRNERLDDALLQRIGDLASRAAQPISDIRGSAAYRTHIVRVLTMRMVALATARAKAAAQPGTA